MLYQKVNFSDFKTAFDKMGRGVQFSVHGLKMLYDWFDEAYSGDDVELDVIALCCQFSEYTREGFLYDLPINGIDSIEDLEQALIGGKIDCVIGYDLDNDIILVDGDYL